MEMLTVSKAKDGFSQVAPKVITRVKSVLINTLSGFVRISPSDLAEEVPPAAPGALRLTSQELEMHTSLGDSL